MTLCVMYLCARALFTESSLEHGLLRVARLGRYGHTEEREAALLLDAFRSGALGPRARRILAVAPESEVVLSAFTPSSRHQQLRIIVDSGNIAAARVLLCDCLTDVPHSQRAKREAKEVASRLTNWLPREAVETLCTGKLTAADIKSLFVPRHAEVNYL
jgi:hypothetical protein